MTAGFFKDEEVVNKAADAPWKKSETDSMLDMYLAGSHPNTIAARLQRNPKAIKRRLEQFTYNERDRSYCYEPFRRISRKGKRLTENERILIKIWTERKLSMSSLAKVLMRDLIEIAPDYKEPSRMEAMKQAAVGIDLVLAYRFLYYVQGISMVSDKAYDDLEKEEIEFGGGSKILERGPSSDRAEDYPPHIRALGLYLAFKYTTRKESNGG